MKMVSIRNILMISVFLGMILSGCQGLKKAPSYDNTIQQLGMLPTSESEQPIQWEIQRLDEPAFFKQSGRGYLALKAAWKTLCGIRERPSLFLLLQWKKLAAANS